jgi:Flp pilus assembly protein TadB
MVAVSRERAQRRAERERAQAEALARQERRDTRTQQRRQRAQRLRTALPRRTRWRTQQGILARRRRLQNLAIAAFALLTQVLVWLFTSDWWLRGAAAVLAVLTVPVLATVVFDRRN